MKVVKSNWIIKIANCYMPAGLYFGFNYLLLLIKEVFGCNWTWKIEDRKQRESFYYYYYLYIYTCVLHFLLIYVQSVHYLIYIYEVKMHTIHHWVTVSYDRLMVPPKYPPLMLTTMIYNESTKMLLKVALNTKNINYIWLSTFFVTNLQTLDTYSQFCG